MLKYSLNKKKKMEENNNIEKLKKKEEELLKLNLELDNKKDFLDKELFVN